jgi:thioredoxin 1
MVLHLLPLVVMMSGQSPPPPPQEVKPAIVLPAKPAQAPRKVYNETADAKAQIADAVKAAAGDEIRVLVNWGANDDERCAKFPALQRAPEMTATRFSDEYKLVYVDVGHLDKNLDVAQAYGANLTAGALPHFTILDQNGKVLANASATDLAVTADPAALDAAKMASFLTGHQAPAPEADGPFKAALSQARKEGKDVFLWFTAPW